MKLGGYSQTSVNRRGGVCSIALAPVGKIAAVSYDGTRREVTAVEFGEPGGAFSLFHFKEDEAHFTETVTCHRGSVMVEHTLTFMLEKMDERSAAAVRELARASLEGMAAVVEMNSGTAFLAGYSQRFGLRCPLRLASSVGTSGLAPSDTTSETVVLRSVDTSKACIFRGSNQA